LPTNYTVKEVLFSWPSRLSGPGLGEPGVDLDAVTAAGETADDGGADGGRDGGRDGSSMCRRRRRDIARARLSPGNDMRGRQQLVRDKRVNLSCLFIFLQLAGDLLMPRGGTAK
jgi:hypothetical protein